MCTCAVTVFVHQSTTSVSAHKKLGTLALKFAEMGGGSCFVLTTHGQSCVRCHILDTCLKSVHSITIMPLFGMLTSTGVRLVCPKCGSAKKSGKRSCCARGGAWFNNCGDTHDMQFSHTWIEGIQACKGRFWRLLTFSNAFSCLLCTDAPTGRTTASASQFANTNGNGCPKCATNMAGKRSCCARGGAWFKNCGDAGDMKGYYTWAEGIEACKSKCREVEL